MDLKTKAVILSLPLLLNACATASKSALMGAAVGGLTGGAIGQSHSQNSQGTAMGMVVGAGIGSLIGYLSYKDKEKKAKVFSLPSDKTLSDEENFPSLTKPKLRSIYVPDKIEGNKYIKGHWIYVIEDPGVWSN